VNVADLISDLLAAIRHQFYPDSSKAWFQQRDAILLCITRPAQWFSDRGVMFPPGRYGQLIQEILQTIKRHGATGSIRYFPAYLGKAIEAHLVHHGDALYAEAKGCRNLAQLALARVRKAPAPAPQEDIVAPLAQARHLLLAARRKRSRTRPASGLQMRFQGL
jgi:hypothetical protein